ncbi:MAG: hypothetical protein KatS3mg109_1995 [Pirellulaceae bacterium]|nr:MAG: hypothetical protein KatS3mg109_1995 [Pirellulaceae bacterium]
MSSLEQRMRSLEKDLLASPPRISAYHDLPFAIFRYDPEEEFPARKYIQLLATRLANAGRRVHPISIARLLWRAIRETEGLAAIAQEERQFGFPRAQRTVSTILSDEAFLPLPDQLQERVRALDPDVDYRLSGPCRRAGPGHLPGRQAAGPDARADDGPHHPLLPRYAGRSEQLAVHGSFPTCP